jgi:hypothetical protein
MKLKLKNNSIIDVDLRSATKKDIDQLIYLNEKFHKSNPLIRLESGYIGAIFPRKTFQELIHLDQVLIGVSANKIISYYLVNNYSNEGVIGLQLDMVNALKSSGILNENDSVCHGVQVVVDYEFMGSGIRTLLFNELCSRMKVNYQYLFGTVAKDNLRSLKALKRDGYAIVGENSTLHYVLCNLKDKSVCLT